MENILLIFLIVLIVWAVAPVLGRWIRRKMLEHFVRRMTGGKTSPFSGFGFSSGASSHFGDFFRQTGNSRQTKQPESRRHRTREFMRQVSETVAFEEMPPKATATPKPGSNVKVESQITDVEWEDIK